MWRYQRPLARSNSQLPTTTRYHHALMSGMADSPGGTDSRLHRSPRRRYLGGRCPRCTYLSSRRNRPSRSWRLCCCRDRSDTRDLSSSFGAQDTCQIPDSWLEMSVRRYQQTVIKRTRRAGYNWAISVSHPLVRIPRRDGTAVGGIADRVIIMTTTTY